MQSALILFPVISSFQNLIQVYDNDYAVIIKKTPDWSIAGSRVYILLFSRLLHAVPPKKEPGFVAEAVYRANLTAYLIADDMDERGLLNYEYGKAKGIHPG